MTESRRKSWFRPRGMLLTALAAAGVLGLTHIPGEDMPTFLEVRDLDKIEHVVAYGLVAGLFLLSLKKPVRPAVLVAGLLALAAIGAVDETTQPFVRRVASMWDYTSDLVGITLACVIFWAVKLAGSRTVLGEEK